MIEIAFPPPNERIVLAGLLTSTQNPRLFEEDMQEMQMLCRTAGADVVETVVQKREKPTASTYLGSGKIKEIRGILKQHKSKTLVIDAELSPGQIRTIEKLIGGKVIDRSQLILDIFAQHARTNEARIQVELAQLRTLYPRLTHAWTHFSEQFGGIGTRGPGEKQLEVDRRLIQKKISDLNQKLKKIEQTRQTQRKSRHNVFKVALVGYTNVGKSSLLNSLCGSRALVENKLFATLDTTTRRTYLKGIGDVIISDTVGFIRKLPHHLVASFKSTLEVVREADLLLLVMDASSEWSAQQLATVREVLDELDVHNMARQVVFNKMDLVVDPFVRKQLMLAFPEALFVSAFDESDIEKLKQHMADQIRDFRREEAKSEIIHRESRTAIARKG
ncbi:MAG: GTPase HflX [Chitinispirillaceae bacterium]